MTIVPVRLRLSRARGFNLQEFSRSVNGLAAVKVDRRTKWGNPFDFRASEYCWVALSYGGKGDARGRQEASVKAFRDWIAPPHGRRTISHEEQPKMGVGKILVALGPKIEAGEAPALEEVRDELRGFNAACWCKLCERHARGKPWNEPCAECAVCHGDVLLELVANAR